MKLKALLYLIIQFGVITSGEGEHERRTKIIKFPTDGPTHISLNGKPIFTSTDFNTSKTSSVNQEKEFMLWVQRQPPDEDFTIDEKNESPIIQLSPDTKIHTVSRCNTISRSKRSQNCTSSLTKSTCLELCSGDLIFEDNFDTMNTSKWHHEVRIVSTNDFEFVSYQKRPENCYVSNGQLYIIPGLLSETPNFDNKVIANGVLDLHPHCTANIVKECFHKSGNANIMSPIISALLTTKRTFQFRYGRVDVRAKLPKGDWLFPLILLEPARNIYGAGNYASGQIRIAFAAGNDELIDNNGNNIGGNLLLGGAVLTTQQSLRRIRLSEFRNKEHLGNDFHIYSVKWTDTNITLAIDGKQYAVIPGEFHNLYETNNIAHASRWKTGGNLAPFDQEFYISLGVAVGGHGDFPDGSRNPRTGRAKPWKNMDPKEKYTFWTNRREWLSTWKVIDTGLRVDYVRVYAL